MKSLKRVSIIGSIIAVLMVLFSTNIFAEHDTTGKYLGLKDKGNGRETGFYTTGTKTGVRPFIPVIKIVEYNDSKGTAEDQSKSEQAIYCLKDGVGFGSAGSSGIIEDYSEYFDLKDPDNSTNPITEKYRAALPQGENYNKLMWLLDNICIPEDDASVTNLLSQAGLEISDFTDYIEDEDELKDILEVVQQSAIWYITNAGDDYQPSDLDTFAVATTNGGIGVSLGSKYNIDEVDNPITILYQYLIDTSATKGNYDYTASNTATSNLMQIDETRATVNLENGQFLVGPYKINKLGDYTSLEAKIYSSTGEITDAKILSQDRTTEITGATTLDKIVSGLGNDFYIALPATTTVRSVWLELMVGSNSTYLEYRSTPESKVSSSQPVVIVNKREETKPIATTSKNIEKPKFDLALRKFITKLNGNNVTPSREPSITQENLELLATGNASIFDNGTTMNKPHIKTALPVNTNGIITYTIRIYNEGEIDGYADEITDYLPEGLELVSKEESAINAKYGWTQDADNSKIIRTDYLSKTKNADENLIKAFSKTQTDGKYSISYKDVEVECKVVANVKLTDTHLKNVAEITEASNDVEASDRDSVPESLTDAEKNNYEPGTSTGGKGYQDDDDYEDLVLLGRYFDLSLRKFITAVNSTNLETDGKYDRAPVVDVSPLLNGSTTASYAHVKKPVSVSAGDIVTYTLRIYNEGQVDGYADEIVDHLPPELEFLPEDEINKKYLWTIDPEDRTQRTIRTQYLSRAHDAEENLIQAYDTTKDTLSYKEIQIRCRVVNTAEALKQITNIAEITASSNDSGLVDRDNERLVTLPQDSELPDYKGNVMNKPDLSDKDYHYEGQEDDDDFEKVILEKFDLALRKFITGVNNNAVNDRVPEIDKTRFGTIENDKQITTFDYNHTKEPVRVSQNDIVIYTIRIYNEGTKSGYASEIKDDIPEGLEFIPDNTINQTFRWVMYDENGNVTNDPKLAKTIRTDYLSKENEQTPGENLLQAYNAETMGVPAYKDVRVSFKVLEPNTSDRIIINHAEISKDTDEDGKEIDDIDSTPDEWLDKDDDQDIEKIYVKYFDLALRKWVSQVILIEDGVQKEMDTNHYAEQDPEPVVKVELSKKRIENTIVKFRYQIRIANEGEIEGYATEISDYIPDGLRFNQADNPKWKEVNGKIVTDQLKDTLLKPGETATIDVVLTWINGEDNMGTKTNVAEISDDDNDPGAPDKDSTPNNKKDGEDDIDDAPVALTVITGSAPKYIAITAGALLIIIAGIFVIKKYVL